MASAGWGGGGYGSSDGWGGGGYGSSGGGGWDDPNEAWKRRPGRSTTSHKRGVKQKQERQDAQNREAEEAGGFIFRKVTTR